MKYRRIFAFRPITRQGENTNLSHFRLTGRQEKTRQLYEL